MKIKVLRVGFLETNCYILSKDGKCIVIDPGDEYERIINAIDGELVAVLVTHYHFDHIGALPKVVEDYGVPVIDINNYKDSYSIGGFYFEMIKTPGHKDDLVSYKFGDKLFCGDFIFEGTIGRCDLPGGDFKVMQDSIRYIINFYEDLVIYPGHGDATTLKREITNLKSYL